MSTQSKTKAKLDAELAQLEAEDAAYERTAPMLEPERIEFDKAGGALSALARSAGSEGTALDLAKLQAQALSTSDRKLRGYGCDFINGAYLFLKILECPPQARDFVLILLALSRGDSETSLSITDVRIGELSDLTRQSIFNKRKALIEWQQAKDWTIIEIQEKPYNRETQKFEPTQYKITFADYVVVFVREMREFLAKKPLSNNVTKENIGVFEDSQESRDQQEAKNARQAFPESVRDDTIFRIADRISSDFPNAPFVPRKKTYSAPRPTHEQVLAGKRARVLASVDEFCADVVSLGGDLTSELTSLERDLGEVIARHQRQQAGRAV